jgi:hypothetical protein
MFLWREIILGKGAGKLNGYCIQAREIRWTEHVPRMGEMTYANKTLVGKPDRRDHSENIRRRWEDNNTWFGLDISGSGYRPVVGCCEEGNEP